MKDDSTVRRRKLEESVAPLGERDATYEQGARRREHAPYAEPDHDRPVRPAHTDGPDANEEGARLTAPVQANGCKLPGMTLCERAQEVGGAHDGVLQGTVHRQARRPGLPPKREEHLRAPFCSAAGFRGEGLR